jgi:hypothetical protein
MHSASPPIAGSTPVAISKGRVRKNNASANINYETNKNFRSYKLHAKCICCFHFAGHLYFSLTALFLAVPYLGPHKLITSSKILQ